jgi:hypothetical protein
MAPAYAGAMFISEAKAMSRDIAMVDVMEASRISLDSDWERRNWMKWLGCSEEELKLAVETMGPDPDNVRRFLRQLH